MSYSIEQIKASYKSCFANRTTLEKSSKCGCFNCLTIFSPKLIKHWTAEVDNQGDTAWCPVCRIDSLIGDESHAINKSFLYAMRCYYFASESNLDPIKDAHSIESAARY
jgi:hypothetical protein